MEQVEWLEWEFLINKINVELTELGPFPVGINTVVVQRLENLELWIEGHGHGYPDFSLDRHDDIKAGQILPTPATAIGQVNKFQVKIDGLNGLEQNWRLGALIISGSARRVEIICKNDNLARYIEWVTNLDPAGLAMPRRTVRLLTKKFVYQRNNEIDFEKEFKGDSFGYDHFKLKSILAGVEYQIICGQASTEKISKKLLPGYIEYQCSNGVEPGENVRRTVRTALSFILGRQLIDLGATYLNMNFEPIKYVSNRVRRLQNDPAYLRSSSPPTNIFDNNREDFISEEKVSRLLDGFVKVNQGIELEYPIRITWIAQSSPLDVQAVHYGAALEALRDSYIKANSKLTTTWFPKKVWKKLREPLLEAFDEGCSVIMNQNDGDTLAGVDYSSSISTVRNNIIGELNRKSSRILYEQFFAFLNLKIGNVEIRALKERNAPAHGFMYENEHYKELSNLVNALKTLFNRAMLRITNGADFYIDYSTYGFPVRSIEEPMGGPLGDGVSADYELKNEIH